MTTFVDSGPLPPVTLLRANLKTGQAGALVISAGTPHQIVVRDARRLYRWSTPSLPFRGDVPRRIVYHHTAVGVPAKRTARGELNLLTDIARSGDYGLPYNFVVMPAPPFRIWYVNDVDMCWPHTYGHNCDCAIAAYGNFSQVKPDARMVGRMMDLADALALMWGQWVEETQHRDWSATECPGNHLTGRLPSLERQRYNADPLPF